MRSRVVCIAAMRAGCRLRAGLITLRKKLYCGASKDSVTLVPDPSGSNVYRQLVSLVLKANSRPGSAAVTSGVVDHRMKPALLRPLNLAPTAGPVAPPTHSHDTVSGLHSPMRVTF